MGCLCFKSKKITKYHNLKKQINTYDQLINMLKENGLETFNLIIGLDCSKRISNVKYNLCKQILTTINIVFSKFNNEENILLYGFNSHEIFSFLKSDFGEELSSDIGTVIKTLDNFILNQKNMKNINNEKTCSLTHIINKAIDVIKRENTYYVLLLIGNNKLDQEVELLKTINEISNFPMIIIYVNLSQKAWENNKKNNNKYNNLKLLRYKKNVKNDNQYALNFAIKFFCEIPDHYKQIKVKEVDILNSQHNFS